MPIVVQIDQWTLPKRHFSLTQNPIHTATSRMIEVPAIALRAMLLAYRCSPALGLLTRKGPWRPLVAVSICRRAPAIAPEPGSVSTGFLPMILKCRLRRVVAVLAVAAIAAAAARGHDAFASEFKVGAITIETSAILYPPVHKRMPSTRAATVSSLPAT
jgi:hypothetical protein